MVFLLNLFSAIALLAFGVALTKKSVLQTCGTSIGNVLRSVLNSKFKAILVGLFTTMLVQSSTATSLLVSSFLKKNLLSLGIALTIMLGADLGTAIMARVLTYDLSLLSPLLLCLGAFFYLGPSERDRLINLGGIMLGLGIILLALSLIVQTVESVKQADLTAMLLTSLTKEPTFALILGAALAVICYSSLAAVLLTSVLCGSGAIDPLGAVAVVIGSNIGSCILEIIGALKQGRSAIRVMVGNTLCKLTIAVIILLLLSLIDIKRLVEPFALSEFVIWFHVIFNAMVCLLLWPCVGLLSRLLYQLLPRPAVEQDPNQPKHLDKTAYIDPNLALSNAVREILSLGDFLQQMFGNLEHSIAYTPLQNPSTTEMRARIREISDKISDYLAGINFESAKQRKKMNKCLIASANVIECAYLINTLVKHFNRANSNFQVSFLPEMRTKLNQICTECASTARLAVNSFISSTKEERKKYLDRKNNCLKLISKFSTTYVSKNLAPEGDLRFLMLLLEVLEQFRQLCGVFDKFLEKNNLQEDPDHAKEEKENI
ncbi:MAG: Na/Pi symporter [Succinivibrio sp.]|nr:Na/Pi symporter [Succinivibrio sp.]